MRRAVIHIGRCIRRFCGQDILQIGRQNRERALCGAGIIALERDPDLRRSGILIVRECIGIGSSRQIIPAERNHNLRCIGRSAVKGHRRKGGSDLRGFADIRRNNVKIQRDRSLIYPVTGELDAALAAVRILAVYGKEGLLLNQLRLIHRSNLRTDRAASIRKFICFELEHRRCQLCRIDPEGCRQCAGIIALALCGDGCRAGVCIIRIFQRVIRLRLELGIICCHGCIRCDRIACPVIRRRRNRDLIRCFECIRQNREGQLRAAGIVAHALNQRLCGTGMQIILIGDGIVDAFSEADAVGPHDCRCTLAAAECIFGYGQTEHLRIKLRRQNLIFEREGSGIVSGKFNGDGSGSGVVYIGIFPVEAGCQRFVADDCRDRRHMALAVIDSGIIFERELAVLLGECKRLDCKFQRFLSGIVAPAGNINRRGALADIAAVGQCIILVGGQNGFAVGRADLHSRFDCFAGIDKRSFVRDFRDEIGIIGNAHCRDLKIDALGALIGTCSGDSAVNSACICIVLPADRIIGVGAQDAFTVLENDLRCNRLSGIGRFALRIEIRIGKCNRTARQIQITRRECPSDCAGKIALSADRDRIFAVFTGIILLRHEHIALIILNRDIRRQNLVRIAVGIGCNREPAGFQLLRLNREQYFRFSADIEAVRQSRQRDFAHACIDIVRIGSGKINILLQFDLCAAGISDRDRKFRLKRLSAVFACGIIDRTVYACRRERCQLSQRLLISMPAACAVIGDIAVLLAGWLDGLRDLIAVFQAEFVILCRSRIVFRIDAQRAADRFGIKLFNLKILLEIIALRIDRRQILCALRDLHDICRARHTVRRGRTCTDNQLLACIRLIGKSRGVGIRIVARCPVGIESGRDDNLLILAAFCAAQRDIAVFIGFCQLLVLMTALIDGSAERGRALCIHAVKRDRLIFPRIPVDFAVPDNRFTVRERALKALDAAGRFASLVECPVIDLTASLPEQRKGIGAGLHEIRRLTLVCIFRIICDGIACDRSAEIIFRRSRNHDITGIRVGIIVPVIGDLILIDRIIRDNIVRTALCKSADGCTGIVDLPHIRAVGCRRKRHQRAARRGGRGHIAAGIIALEIIEHHGTRIGIAVTDRDDMRAVQHDELIEGMARIVHGIGIRVNEPAHRGHLDLEHQVCLMPAVHFSAHMQNQPCSVIGAAQCARIKRSGNTFGTQRTVVDRDMLDELPVAAVLSDIQHRQIIVFLRIVLTGNQIEVSVLALMKSAPDRQLHGHGFPRLQLEIRGVVFNQRLRIFGVGFDNRAALHAHPAGAGGNKA